MGTLSTISSVTLSDTDSSSLTLSDNDPMDPDNVGNNVEINIDRKNGKIIAKSINPHSSSDDRCLNTDYLTSSVSSTDDEIHITDDDMDDSDDLMESMNGSSSSDQNEEGNDG